MLSVNNNINQPIVLYNYLYIWYVWPTTGLGKHNKPNKWYILLSICNLEWFSALQKETKINFERVSFIFPLDLSGLIFLEHFLLQVS